MLYKLTDHNSRTYNNTQWGENVTHTTSGDGELCGPGWLHAYTHPLLAAMLNPIHANFYNPLLYLAEGKIEKTDHGLKIGTTKLTTLRLIKLPEVSTVQRVAFAILCAKHVYESKEFHLWADGWLSGKDRSDAAAYAAAGAAYVPLIKLARQAMKIT